MMITSCLGLEKLVLPRMAFVLAFLYGLHACYCMGGWYSVCLQCQADVVVGGMGHGVDGSHAVQSSTHSLYLSLCAKRLIWLGHVCTRMVHGRLPQIAMVS